MSSTTVAGRRGKGAIRPMDAGERRPEPRRHHVRMIFVNLPVTDLERAKAFYAGLGFGFNEQFSDEKTASVVIDENIVVMLLTRERFADFVRGEVGDPSRATSVLNALSCSSREEVDDLLSRAVAHGGKPYRDTQDHGFMYAASFTDPDGNVWEPMWMDPSAVQ
ncbi:VOC family protein [Geodermatophilus sp. YIM 151500]|uniref:VOC family protein n=1 Tax=Geodermatophilus sp. YIM 151500 TaxID=2984531 RepID=UPI0021E384E4|nr:VOC family protein [Geodermatophilus sp. YIM 151500]MCV2490155.1 VOC family protein [Geodermatophilus sp. YIM 151500]